MGDNSCVKVRVLSNTRIMCGNSDGKETGYRNAMTDQQLEMYRFNQQQKQQARDNFKRSMESLANRNKTVYCNKYGNMTICN